MTNQNQTTVPRQVAVVLFIILAAASPTFAQTNIDPANKFAWSENAGWLNWRGEAEPGQGVLVGGTFMSGFIWSENAGWINAGNGMPANGIRYANLDGADFGVNIDPDGTLHGFAWGENIGWLNFDGGAMATPPDPARIECDGRLDCFVWGENVGWINLSAVGPMQFVSVDTATIPVGCDLNHDGTVNGLDVSLFVGFVVQQMMPDWRDVCSGDVEIPPDKMIDIDDVADFVACLLG